MLPTGSARPYWPESYWQRDGGARTSDRAVHLRARRVSRHPPTLFPTCLVHRSDNHLETLPLSGVTAVRVSFERDTRKLGWGIGLVVAALVMLAIAGPISTFAAGAAGDMASAGTQGVPRALYGFFRTLEALAQPAAGRRARLRDRRRRAWRFRLARRDHAARQPARRRRLYQYAAATRCCSTSPKRLASA